MKEISMLLKNFSSSFLGSLVANIFGFILLLYLPNTIGVEKYGIYNFALAFNTYFLMFTDLGISIYSVKYINNQYKEESNIKNYINKAFSIKIYLGILGVLFSIIILLIMNVEKEKFIFTAILNISIIATSMCIDYLFNAFNQMKYSAYNLVIKNVCIFILCFMFVKDGNDLLKIAIIYTVSLFLSSFFLLAIFKKNFYPIKLIRINSDDFSIIKATFPLAVSLIMIQINNNFDILYLSFTKGDIAVGIYSAAYKIINFLIALLVVYFNASYPNIARLYNENKEELSNYLEKFFRFGLFIILPLTIGGVILGDKIINLVYDSSYSSAVGVFKILIILLLVRFIGSTYASILLMGSNSKSYTFAVIIGATINIFLNILFAPYFSYIGCAFATVISEIVQLVIFIFYFKKELNTKMFKNVIPIVISTVIMSITIIIFKQLFNIFILIFIGVITYFTISFLLYYVIKMCKGTIK